MKMSKPHSDHRLLENVEILAAISTRISKIGINHKKTPQTNTVCKIVLAMIAPNELDMGRVPSSCIVSAKNLAKIMPHTAINLWVQVPRSITFGNLI